ncbi:hypothetical protein FLAK523_02625 [Flavobacterium sp. K5-23]|nr:hypothetical protein FLAK523_02625 [Flavobacterium sp. K5-23]
MLLLLFSVITFAQNNKNTYVQFDVTIPITGNPNRDEVDPYTNKSGSWFIPDGIGSKLGYGLHFKKWVALGIHSGLEWKFTDQLVVAPVFANFRLSPKINKEILISLQLGLGKTFALGRGDLMGEYKKISLGIQTSDGLLLFIEASSYGIPINNQKETGSLSLGISLISF